MRCATWSAVISRIRSGFGLTGSTATSVTASSESEGDTMAALTNAEVTVSDAPLDVTLGTPEPK